MDGSHCDDSRVWKPKVNLKIKVFYLKFVFQIFFMEKLFIKLS